MEHITLFELKIMTKIESVFISFFNLLFWRTLHYESSSKICNEAIKLVTKNNDVNVQNKNECS